MAEERVPSSEINDNDKLMSLLAYIIGLIVPLIILLSDSNKNRPFQRYHAIQSLLLSAVFFIFSIVVGCLLGLITIVAGLLTLGIGVGIGGIGGICSLPLGLVFLGITIYFGIEAYQGKYVVIPMLTDFAKKQNWL